MGWKTLEVIALKGEIHSGNNMAYPFFQNWTGMFWSRHTKAKQLLGYQM